MDAESFLAVASGLSTTVPVFGLGIKPLGPKILASLTSFDIWEGEANSKSKSIMPDSMLATILSSAMAIFRTLPVEKGSSTVAETPDLAKFIWSSTVGSNLVRLTSFSNLSASAMGYVLVMSILALAVL